MSLLRGAAFLMKETIQIDASIGTNVKNTPNYIFGGFGISWRFDENYNDVINRVKKEKGKKDKGKDKKDKGKDNSNEKANKRKDSFGLEIKK